MSLADAQAARKNFIAAQSGGDIKTVEGGTGFIRDEKDSSDEYQNQ